MKFKPIYIYGILSVIVVIVLIIASQQSSSVNEETTDVSTNQNTPDDNIHNPSRSGNTPGKDNVSESFKQKLQMLKNAVEESPNDTTKIKEYADLLAAAHKKKEAASYYQRILDIDPNRIDIRFSLSFIYYSLSDLTKAEEETKEILRIDPDNVNAQFNMGVIAASRGENEKAKEIWMKIVIEHPNEEVGIKAKKSIGEL
ncbi:cellulose synthase subunit BcsC [bacterium BMS3Abin03]|nr:cellulose synthase subunit BcsC [bacterium BMS3Abin03]